MSRNIVKQSVMKTTNTDTVKKTSVKIRPNGLHAKLTLTFLILTSVRVPVKIHPEVAMLAQTQKHISTAQSQEFVSKKTFSVMDTSTVSMEKMKILAFQPRKIILTPFLTPPVVH